MSFEEIKMELESNEELRKLCKIILALKPDVQQNVVSALTEWMRLPEKDRTRERLEILWKPYM